MQSSWFKVLVRYRCGGGGERGEAKGSIAYQVASDVKISKIITEIIIIMLRNIVNRKMKITRNKIEALGASRENNSRQVARAHAINY